MYKRQGFDGQVGVYGLPSGRLLKHVPVFSQNPENGWGYSEQTKAMMNTSYGVVPWDDAHHPQLSQMGGVPDGRWLFINGNNTPRIARLDLTRFETEEILEIPNSGGNHSSPFVTENNEYVVAGTRFSVPAPQRDVSIDDYKEAFSGVLTFARVDSATGHLAFVILQISTTLILVLAANTAYADFPRLASFAAGDEFLPRQFTTRGHRLVFSNGIIALSAAAIGLVIIFQADVGRLIP